MTPQHVGSLGILCSDRSGNPPFSEQHYCRRLSQAGAKYGLTVVVLCPRTIQLLHHQVNGYVYGDGGWKKVIVPIPDMFYDRCFHKQGKDKRILSKLLTLSKTQKQSLLWARGLPGKWQVYNKLKVNPTLVPYLPLTTYYSGPESLIRCLETYQGQVFLKPQAGSQGKLTLHVQIPPSKDRFMIRGRDHHNKELIQIFDTAPEALAWVHQFIHHRPFIIQPYLHLSNKQGHPFDIRVLMQKNGEGRWILTGMAVRQGQLGGVTSNLHGGGTARPVPPFLTREYGTALAEHIMTVLHKLSNDIPPILESYFGRLGELGIDYGIDPEGNVWLLEANSKPGRSSFDHIGEQSIAILATENPLRYARYLLLRQLRRVNS
ncbi:YheC/YheD family protein [Paenibacillus sp. FA6]|uniref:YheC/YheD family endospore coat-associated protein n=1 Tax=Paenibacillus sp. FA6 TaxID=3413029 RepID=UPI003F65F446